MRRSRRSRSAGVIAATVAPPEDCWLALAQPTTTNAPIESAQREERVLTHLLRWCGRENIRHGARRRPRPTYSLHLLSRATPPGLGRWPNGRERQRQGPAFALIVARGVGGIVDRELGPQSLDRI